jgi:hypothetical protein
LDTHYDWQAEKGKKWGAGFRLLLNKNNMEIEKKGVAIQHSAANDQGSTSGSGIGRVICHVLKTPFHKTIGVILRKIFNFDANSMQSKKAIGKTMNGAMLLGFFHTLVAELAEMFSILTSELGKATDATSNAMMDMFNTLNFGNLLKKLGQQLLKKSIPMPASILTNHFYQINYKMAPGTSTEDPSVDEVSVEDMNIYGATGSAWGIGELQAYFYHGKNYDCNPQ